MPQPETHTGVTVNCCVCGMPCQADVHSIVIEGDQLWDLQWELQCCCLYWDAPFAERQGVWYDMMMRAFHKVWDAEPDLKVPAADAQLLFQPDE